MTVGWFDCPECRIALIAPFKGDLKAGDKYPTRKEDHEPGCTSSDTMRYRPLKPGSREVFA